MPFKSKKQQRWMYANKPEMAKEWSKETDFKKLPEKVKKKKELGGILHPKECKGCMQSGGYTSQQQIEAANQFAKDFAKRKHTLNPEDVYVARSVGDPIIPFEGNVAKALPKSTFVPKELGINDIINDGNGYFYTDPQTGDLKEVDSSVISQPRFNRESQLLAMKQMGGRQMPFIQGDSYDIPGDEKMDFNLEQFKPDFQNDIPYSERTPVQSQARQKTKEPWDPYFMLHGAKTGLAWLGNQLENKRQNQYLQQQLSTLGQLDPMPVQNFQPNPFSLYAKFGGSLRKYQRGGLTRGLVPQPQYRISQTARPATARDSAEYLSNFNRAPQLSTMAPGVLGGHTSKNMLEYQMKTILAPAMHDAINDGSRVNYDYAANQYSALQDWYDRAGVLSDEQVAAQLQQPLPIASDARRPQQKKGGSFKINPAHKGFCTPMTKSTCTGKRRQFALNMKKMARANKNG